MTTPQSTLEELNNLLDTMQTVLLEEREALENRNVESLSQCTEQKNLVLESLSATKFGTDLQAKIQELPEEQRTECETVHTETLSRLKEIQDFNLVNGKILNRSQNSIREILHLLSGRAPDGLYGESGQPKNDTETGRDSIARA